MGCGVGSNPMKMHRNSIGNYADPNPVPSLAGET